LVVWVCQKHILSTSDIFQMVTTYFERQTQAIILELAVFQIISND